MYLRTLALAGVADSEEGKDSGTEAGGGFDPPAPWLAPRCVLLLRTSELPGRFLSATQIGHEASASFSAEVGRM